MELEEYIGAGKDLTVLQISCRAVLIFFIAYCLIRISGRRSFGLHGPMDNIIVILLGAILSRAVVGASPFIPVIAASIVIVLLHRTVSWLVSVYPQYVKFADGKKIILFENGKFIDSNMRKALICKEEIQHAVRKELLTEKFNEVEKIFMEINGEISIIKKDHEKI